MPRPNELLELRHEPLTQGQEHRFVLRVPVDLPVLAGHFPGSPIVPAFVELREVVRRVGRAWPGLGRWHGATSLKFQAPIRPGAELELRLARPDGGHRVRFTLTIVAGEALGTQCATGTLVFGEEVAAPRE